MIPKSLENVVTFDKTGGVSSTLKPLDDDSDHNPGNKTNSVLNCVVSVPTLLVLLCQEFLVYWNIIY